MRKLALVFAILAMKSAVAMADEIPWPDLKPGEVKALEKGYPIPGIAKNAAGFGTADVPPEVKITFFKAAHGSEYMIISPCCGPQGGGASLFEHINDIARPVALTVGDPRKGFTTQPFADAISIDPGAKALRARIAFSDCEQGVWGYYYLFDEIDRPLLVSVIDTSCTHLGVREFYHSANAKVGHWWQH